MTTTTTPTDAELTAGLWTYERWPEDYAEPMTLVGTVDPTDHDDCEDDCVRLDVVDAPSGARFWTVVPRSYIVPRTALRPAWSEEVATVLDHAEQELDRLTAAAERTRADVARYRLAYEQAWHADAES